MSLAFDAKDRVRQSTDIVDLVSGYMELRRQGAKFVGLCPWHDDSKPSLNVDPNRQSWKCWVCNLGGDVFSFVMQKENVDFLGALEILADRAGIEIQSAAPRTSPGDANDKKTLFSANDWAAEQFHRCLTESNEAHSARQYLAARGINDDSIQSFRIGYSPNHWTWLCDRSKTLYSPRVLEGCGLVGQSERGGKYYDKLRGRLIFPIHDTQNRAIAFGGRVLPEVEEEVQAKGQRVAKYWNSPETRLFSKSDNLYGLNVVRDELSRNREAVVVEGYTDVVMAHQAGLRNVVAALGTAINERHIRVLKRFADRITLLLDGDEAGQRRTNEILELFVASDADLRVLTLPNQLDPFDYVQKFGGDALRELLSTAVDALEFKIRKVTGGLDLINDTHGASQALENVLQTLSKVPRPVQTDGIKHLREQQVMTRLSRLFQIDIEQIGNRLRQLRRNSRPTTGESLTASKPMRRVVLQECDSKELELLEILLIDENLFAEAVEHISPDQFSVGPLRDLFETYIDLSRGGTALDFASVMTHLEDPEIKNLLAEIDGRAQKKHVDSQISPRERLSDVVERFTRMVTENKARQVQARLDQPNLSDNEEADLLKAHFEMKLHEHRLTHQQEDSAPKDG